MTNKIYILTFMVRLPFRVGHTFWRLPLWGTPKIFVGRYARHGLSCPPQHFVASYAPDSNPVFRDSFGSLGLRFRLRFQGWSQGRNSLQNVEGTRYARQKTFLASTTEGDAKKYVPL